MEAFLDRSTPDVVCLQEIKVKDEEFPRDLFEQRGYHIEIFGQKTYNGVAIASRTPISDVARGFDDGDADDQARFMAATTHGLRVMCAYVPNGSSLDSPKFVYKMQWLERLSAYLDTRWASHPRSLLCGDFNIAPEPLDVHDPQAWEGQVLFSEGEREALSRLSSRFGWLDALRSKHPGESLFTWWDYRMLGFPKNKGLRIDHLFLSQGLAPELLDAGVDREERKGTGASDHAPVWITLTS